MKDTKVTKDFRCLPFVSFVTFVFTPVTQASGCCLGATTQFHARHNTWHPKLLDFASEAVGVQMYLYDNITWEQFEQKFREVFSREMTPDEHRWFHAVWTITSRTREGKSESAVA